jgi:predicted membrane protein
MSEASTTDRARFFVPFALSGAAFGVVLALMFCSHHPEQYGQTNLQDSVSFTVATTTVAGMVGIIFSSRPGSLDRLISTGVLLSTSLLGASLGSFIADDLADRSKESARCPFLQYWRCCQVVWVD